MARIADNELKQIKEDISLYRLVEAKGIKLEKKGADYHCLCPFHDDETPSLVVTPSKNLFHCFGCGAAGSVIDWVMKMEGVSVRHALEILKADYLPKGVAKPIRKNTVIKLPSLAASPDYQSQLRNVINYYHQSLKESPEALDYLSKRGLQSSELIEKFKLGYANRTLAYRLPHKNRKEGAEVRTQLQEIGLLRDSGHEHFNGSIVVPVIDSNGIITEVYGRKLRDNLRKGTAKHLYLPGAHVGIWNSEALKSCSEIILCESLIDAMTFWVHGFRNVTTSYGTNGFTDEIFNSLVASGVEKVLIAYDRDKAGNEAAKIISKRLSEKGVTVFRIQFPKGMDANEYSLKVTPADKSLGLAIRKAEWMAGSKNENIPAHENIIEVEGMKIDESTGEILQRESLPLVADSQSLPSESLVDALVSDHEVKINLGDRNYRVRGLNKNMSYEQLKINLLISCHDKFHVDTFDIYSAKHRMSYVKQVSIELDLEVDVIKNDLGKVLLKLEELQDKQIQGTLDVQDNCPKLSDVEVKEALSLLKSKDLVNRVLDDFNRAGVVGEETNKLIGYLAGVSRKLDKPLAVLIQSSSAAGKTSLMDACLSFMPEEECIQYSAMTGQSLFYMGETSLKNKVLAIAEEEGAENTSYALKLLQSEGEVTMASTGKNSVTGNLETQEYRVEGPVALFSTTTAIDIDEELLNRCIVLTVDESREQTEAIHVAQRRKRTLAGLHAKIDQEAAQKLHANAQRLLKPLMIINPYADDLTFLSDKTRTRRDHEKYLGLIDAITLLHQYQRETKCTIYNNNGIEKAIEYIEVTLDDIALANKLAHEVLGRSLDELPPQTRKLLNHINDMVQQQCCRLTINKNEYRFSRKDVRHYSGWTDFQVKKHMHRLEEMEYVLVHSGSRGKSIVYELLYNNEGQQGNSFIMGLIDVEKLKYDSQKEPLKQEKKPSSSPQKAPKLPPSSTNKKPIKPTIPMHAEEELQNLAKSTYSLEKNKASYRSDTEMVS